MNAGDPESRHDGGGHDGGHDGGPGEVVLRKTRRRRPMTPKRLVFGCCKLAAAVVVLAVVGAGILALRLQSGPIEIDGLGEKIASALHDRFGKGMSFALGRTAMVQRGFGPTLSIDKLSISGADGRPILSAPNAEVSVDPLALLVGKVVPRRLEVLDVTLRLVLLENGTLAVAAGDDTKPFAELGKRPEAANAVAAAPAQAGGRTPAADEKAAAVASPAVEGQTSAAPTHRAIVMKQAAAAIRQFVDILTDPHSAIAAVDRLGIKRGKLVIDDRMTGEQVVYKGLDLAFDKSRSATAFTLSAEGPSGRWSVAAMARGVPGRERRFGVKVDNLSIDEIQLIAGSRSLGVETDMPIALEADLGLKPDNTLSEASGNVRLGEGFLRTSDPDQEPILLKELSGALHWKPDDRVIEVDPSQYVEKSGTRFVVAGSIKPPLDEGQPWLIDLATTKPGYLAPDRKGQSPYTIDEGRFDARLFLDRKTMAIDRLAFHSKEGGIALAGAFDWLKGPHLKLGATIDPTSVQFAQRVWPAFMASTVRAWVLDHFETGLLTSGTIRLDYDETALKRLRSDRSPPDPSVALDFTLSKGSLRFLDGVPPITNVDGVGHITGRTSRFTLSSGVIDANGKPIQVPEGTFSVANANIHPTPATLTAKLTGSVEAVTDILSRDALKPYASLPLDPSTLHGQIEGSLEKSLLLGTHGQRPDEPLRVDAKVTDFKADHIVGPEGLEDATLAISVGDGKLKAAGQGRIFGGAATFDIERAGEGPPIAQIAVTLDDAARAKLGLSAIPGLSGPMTARVNANLGDPAKLKAQIDLDLAKTTIAAGFLGLAKPAGRPAKVSFMIEPREERMSIEQLVVEIAALQARGAVELGSDYGFQSAHFSSFKVSPGDDMRLDVGKSEDGYRVTIRGSTIDARPFIKAVTSNASPEAAHGGKSDKKAIETLKGFDIDLKTAILTGFNKEVMNAVDLKLSKRGSQYRQFAVHGRFGGDAVSGSMGANQRLKIASADAGALVSFIDLYKHMEGGALAASMQVSDDALDGNLEIDDFVLRNEPAIQRLVAQTETESASGPNPEAARKINARAVGFKRLKVNFERAGSRVQLSDATMYGNEIGLSVDGWLDYVHDRVAMNGTFVPVFALNNMFAQLPVVGVLLGGKSNEGLLAITFKISGSASTPTLSINPLSVVTPGFLRNIFGALDSGGIVPPDAAGAGAGAADADPSR